MKLKYLDEDNHRRQTLATYYYDHITNPLIMLPSRLPDENNVYHQFPIFCEYRDELQGYLTSNGVQTLIHYPIPPHKQECYAGEPWNTYSQTTISVRVGKVGSGTCCPITERIHRQELSIPMNQVLTIEDAAEIVRLLNMFSIE